MAYYTIDNFLLTNIADNIRLKLGTTTKYKPQEMPAAIRSIPINPNNFIIEDSIITRTITSYDNSNILEIDYDRFRECQALTSLSATNARRIGGYACFNCANLTTINLPNVIHIGAYAFGGCDSLSTVSLPKVEQLDSTVFQDDFNLTSLTLSGDKVVYLYDTLTGNANTPMDNGTGIIYVPSNLVDAYKNDSQWSKYASQIRSIGG